MSETETPTPTPTPISVDERRRILKQFLDKKVVDIRIENPPADAAADTPSQSPETAGPSRIIQANADGSLKPTPPPPDDPDRINFRAFPDGTFAKFTEIPQRPGFYAICLNTAKQGDPDVLNQVSIVKKRAVADLLCDGVNALMQVRIVQQQMQAAAQEEANETACELARMDGEGSPQPTSPGESDASAPK